MTMLRPSSFGFLSMTAMSCSFTAILLSNSSPSSVGQFTAAEHNGGLDLISAFKETNGIFGLDIKVVFFNADTQFDFLTSTVF